MVEMRGRSCILAGRVSFVAGNRLTFGGTGEDCGASSSICGGNTK